MPNPSNKQNEAKKIRESYKGKRFEDLMRYDLRKIKTPQQFQMEILFEMMHVTIQLLDKKEEYKSFLEHKDNEWYICMRDSMGYPQEPIN